MADPHHLQTLLGPVGYRRLLLDLEDLADRFGAADHRALGFAGEAARLVNKAAEQAEQDREREAG